MRPINNFFNKTEEFMQPLKEILKEYKVVQNLKDLKKLYLSNILLLPRAMNLCILIIGMITRTKMTIIPAIEPNRIVDAYGNICIFSFIFVLGAQLSIFHILSYIGIPFYNITTRLGIGFMYDIACDSIMVSIWIGMKNEFFFER